MNNEIIKIDLSNSTTSENQNIPNKKADIVKSPPAKRYDLTKEYFIVAEDSVPNRTILKVILTKLGFAVLECNDGKDGVVQLQICEKENLNLIGVFSDYMMPNLDGMEYLKVLRQHAKFKNVPFVFVSAISAKEQVIEARKHGISGYIVKPISFDKVWNKIRELFPDKKLIPLSELSKKVS